MHVYSQYELHAVCFTQGFLNCIHAQYTHVRGLCSICFFELDQRLLKEVVFPSQQVESPVHIHTVDTHLRRGVLGVAYTLSKPRSPLVSTFTSAN